MKRYSRAAVLFLATTVLFSNAFVGVAYAEEKQVSVTLDATDLNVVVSRTVDGISVSYPSKELFITEKIDKSKVFVTLTYAETYFDGSVKKGVASTDKPTSFSIDKDTVSEGNNTYTVSVRNGGNVFANTFSVTGKAPQVTNRIKSGISIASSPVGKNSGDALGQSEFVAYWIYDEEYSDGTVKRGVVSEDRLTDFVISPNVVGNGDTTVTVSSGSLSAKCNVFGNYVQQVEVVSVDAKYAYNQQYVGESIDKSFIVVSAKVKETYADGTKKERKTVVDSFSLLGDGKIKKGENKFVVTANLFGEIVSASFTVNGAEKVLDTENREDNAESNEDKSASGNAEDTTGSSASVSTSDTVKEPETVPEKEQLDEAKDTGAVVLDGTVPETETEKENETVEESPVLPNGIVEIEDSPIVDKNGPGKKSVIINKFIGEHKIQTVYAEDEENAPDGAVQIKNVEELLNAVLTEADLKAYENGADVQVVLNVNECNDLSDDDKKAISNALDKKEYLGEMISIDLGKYVDGKLIQSYETLSVPLEICVDVPKDLQKDGREFFVMRLQQGGEISKFFDTDDVSNKITFETDALSGTYVIAYNDAGVSNSVPAIPIAMSVAFIIMIFFFLYWWVKKANK